MSIGAAAHGQSAIALESLGWDFPGWNVYQNTISRDGTKVAITRVTGRDLEWPANAAPYIENRLWQRGGPLVTLPTVILGSSHASGSGSWVNLLAGGGQAAFISSYWYGHVIDSEVSSTGVWKPSTGYTELSHYRSNDPFGPHVVSLCSDSGDAYLYGRFSVSLNANEQFVHAADGTDHLVATSGSTYPVFDPVKMSADGTMVVGNTRSDGNQRYAWRWSAPGPITPLPQLDFPQAFGSDLSADGSIIVGVVNRNGVTQAVRWVNGVLELLPVPPTGALSVQSVRVSSDGQLIVVAGYSSNGYKLLTWSLGGGWRDVDELMVAAGLSPITTGQSTYELTHSVIPGPDPGTYALILRTGQKVILGQPCTGTTENTWIGPSGGNYSDPANWQGGTPGIGDNIYARFVTPDIYAVHVDPASLYVEAYSVSAGDVTFDLQGNTGQLNAGNTVCGGYSLEVARNPNEQATARITNGVMNTAQSVWLGNNTGTNATLDVQSGSTLRAGAPNAGHGLHVARSDQSSASVNVNQNAIVRTDTLRVASGANSSGTVTANPGAKLTVGSSGPTGTSGSTSLAAAPMTTATITATGNPILPPGDQTVVELGALRIGDGATQGGQGHVHINNASILRTLVVDLGVTHDSVGTIDITGPDSLWDHYGSGNITIGKFGTGNVTIDRGSVIGGTATLNMTDFASSLIIGGNTGGNGTLTVRGEGARINASGHVAGIANDFISAGTMRIENGADVRLGSLTIGNLGSTASLVLTGQGSTLACDLPGDLQGLTGFFLNFSTATVADGATLNTTLAAIAEPTPVTQVTMSVTGPNTTWTNSGHLYVGWGRAGPGTGGHGTLAVSGGASVQTGTLCVGDNGRVTGNVLQVGGTNFAPVDIYTDALFISPGSVLDVRQTIIAADATLGGGGTWPAPFANSGFVIPGTPGISGAASTLTMAQGFTQTAGGTLSVGVGSRKWDVYDDGGCDDLQPRAQKLDVLGTAVLGGTLRVRFFQPADSCQALPPATLMTLGPIEVLSATTLQGAFESVVVDESLAPYRAAVSYDDAQGKVFVNVLEPPPPCPADFNQDGGIDGTDVSSFFASWENGDPSADVNADGGVDGADVTTFFAAWEAGGCG